jgi:hypothetical protein
VNCKRLLPRVATTAALVLAVGCGGGDGPSELTISQQNAEALAGQGVGAVGMVESMTEMVDMLSQGVLDPAAQMISCPDGGSARTTINDVLPAGPSTGDSADITFIDCTIDLGSGTFLTLNNTFGFDLTDVSGDPLDPAGGTREIQASFGGLSIGIAGATMVLQGGITVSLSSPDGDNFTSSVGGSHFGVYASAGTQAFSGALDDFLVERTWTESTGDYSVTIDATIYSSELGGFATFATTDPFTGNTSSLHPSAGTFVATGAMGGKLTLVALDDVNVQILIDEDGNDVNETTINTTWDALENS